MRVFSPKSLRGNMGDVKAMDGKNWREGWEVAQLCCGAFLKWILLALLLGGVTGVLGAAFHHALDWATVFRQDHGWMIFLLPIAGLAIVASYHVTGMADDRGTEFVLASVREGRTLRIRTVPLIFLGTIMTHLTGGSAGREGAALQIGGCMGSFLGKALRLDKLDQRVITMCGMAGGFSALFGTPLTAAVFSMETESIGVMYYAALVPCVLCALCATLVSQALGGGVTAFALSDVPSLGGLTLLQAALLGVLCALAANLFCRTMEGARRLYDRFTPNPWLRVTAGGAVIVLLTLIFGTDYNGAGMESITAALSGQTEPAAFALKMVFTALTLAAGFKGGEIVPTLFIGATLGCTVSPLMGLDGGFGAAVGMVAVFCGVTNAPLTSILLGYELFGGAGVGLMALACAVSYMLSGYSGLYHEQKIMYSKIKPHLVDLKAGEHPHLKDIPKPDTVHSDTENS